MKRLLAMVCCALVLCLTLLSTGMAWAAGESVSEEERAFIAQCSRRLKKTVTGYADVQRTQAYETIAAGTYCNIVNDFHSVVRIAYYKNGERHTACVNKDELVGCYTQYKDDHGNTHTVYTGDPNYAAIIAGHEVTYLAESLRQNLDEQTGQDAKAGDDGEKVSLTRLGVSTSTIVHQGKTKEVPTAELSFGGNVPSGKEIAVIYAPKTGKASLRSKASDSGKLLKTAKAGVLVRVLDYGKTWTRIVYKEQAGYIKTNCLKFYGAGAQAQGTAQISYNGKTNGSTTVNIRNAADKSSAKIAEWETGTEVTVYNLSDGWYEVEFNGIRGFVMEKYLTIQE